MQDNSIQFAKSLISNPDIKVVSFDIFDTLLFRPGLQPEDIFHLVAVRARQHWPTLDFFSIRRAAEKDFLERSLTRNNFLNIEDIYSFISKSYALDEKLCKDLLAYELEIESQFLQPREDISDLYRFAANSGKKIIAVSDMYLSSITLARILENKGLPVSKVYVSNETKKRKDLGNFQNYILETEGLSASQMIHIGDNFKSDYSLFISAGIKAVYLPKILSQIQTKNPLYKNVLTGNDLGSPYVRLILGLALQSWYSRDPIHHSDSLFDNDHALFGYIGLGPVLFHVVNTIAASKDIQEQYREVAFASRDGFLPELAYKILRESRDILPSRYVHCGRLAYNIYRYNGEPYTFLTSFTDRSNEYTLRSFLKSVFLPKYPSLFEKIQASLTEDQLDAKYNENTGLLSRVCSQFSSELKETFEREKSLAETYYKKNCVPNSEKRSIIFDVGYGGSVSNALTSLTGNFVDKIYLKENSDNRSSDIKNGTKTWELLPDHKLTDEVYGLYLLFEELFSPAEAGCIGFAADAKNDCIPLLNTDEHFSKEMSNKLGIIQSSALDFVRLAQRTFGTQLDGLTDNESRGLTSFIRYAFNLSPAGEHTLFDAISFPDNFFHNFQMPLSLKLNPAALNPRCAMERVRFSKSSSKYEVATENQSKPTRVCFHIYLFDPDWLQPIALNLHQYEDQIHFIFIVFDQATADLTNQSLSFLRKSDHLSFEVRIAPKENLNEFYSRLAAESQSFDIALHLRTRRMNESHDLSPCIDHLVATMFAPDSTHEIIQLMKQREEIGILFPPPCDRCDTSSYSPHIHTDESFESIVKIDEALEKSGLAPVSGLDSAANAFWYRPSVLDSFTSSFEETLKSLDPAHLNSDLALKTFERMIPICSTRKGQKMEPYLSRTYLLRSFAENRANYQRIHREWIRSRDELSSVYHSKQWKLGSLIKKIADRLLPKRTKRRRFAQQAFKKARAFLQDSKVLRVHMKSRIQKLTKSIRALVTSVREIPLSFRIKREIKNLKNGSDGSPLFSVIIPIYDRTWQLEGAIESILRQTFTNFELILVCDGSPQETLDVVDRYAANPRVRIHKFLDNSGNACRGRNTGIRMSKGKYVSFMDSDDIASPKRLEITLYHFLRTQADMIYGSVSIISDGVRKLDGIWDGQFRKSFELDIKEMEEVNPAWTCTVSVKKDALNKFGPFRNEMRYREDHELWLRLAYNGCKLYAAPEQLASYRFHKNNAELLFKDQDSHWKDLMLKMYKLPYSNQSTSV